MHILDKTINATPWERMTEAERAAVIESGAVAPWMFEQKMTLTVCDDAGKVQQLDGSTLPVKRIRKAKEVVGETKKPVGEAKVPLGEGVREFFGRVRARVTGDRK